MYKQYIGGKTVEGQGKPLAVLNPANGKAVATFATATAGQALEALEAAQTAFKTWSITPINERINWMLKLRDGCLAEKEKIIALVSAESGRPYAAATADFNWFMISLAYYGEEVKRINGAVIPNLSSPYGGTYYLVEKRPLGVVVGHLAWNYPLGNAGIKIGPAMASGCSCIIKPSSETPLSLLQVGEIAERIGLPAGVLNILSGPSNEVGRTLNTSTIPRMITLIGSSETGRQVMREGATSVKKYSFELGGNAPVIVMDDVEIDKVAASIVAKKTGFAGQTCVNYNRIYVHEKIYDELCASIAGQLKLVGFENDAKFVCSPLITRAARDRMLELIDDAVASGAELVTGGKIPAGYEAGNFITPALLKNVNDSMRVSKEEIFGPIIPLQPFSCLDKALEQANDTIYGLSAYFYGHDSRDIGKALRTFEAGEIFVNGADGNELIPHSGTKQSGVGCDKSSWSLEEYFDFKTIAIVP